MNSDKKFSSSLMIGKTKVEKEGKPYFIADIGANHNGCLNKAIDLINLAAESGADAAKFQHFKAETIVSKYGFENLTSGQSHQSKWKKSVFDVYKDASIDLDWTQALVDACKKAGIEFFTSPYSLDLVDFVDPFVPAYKVGSGDITWHDIIEKMGSKKKPLLLACGASTLDEICAAVNKSLNFTSDVILMQCNTNYTASLDNFKYINLNVLKTLRSMYPDAILGLSDHTPGHATALGAIALGANVIEKHFTDDNKNEGPDHKFAMNPQTWKEMVERSQELFLALGSGVKTVEDNEKETVVVQRRSIRVKKNMEIGQIICKEDLECLRPCPIDAIEPYNIESVVGKAVSEPIKAGEYLRWNQLRSLL
ncbi:TPA: N-acetylneuraminate synthase family protein [Vibrio vulnificus]|uniref:N-acetylneuraminate synthase family protein n=1 Tax=Vibrio vulnificus TaxID=672 RepID=UPI0021D9AC81|nr:N-acetylneuraminate synthase family protein [Vibrio vulnificus]ELV8677622.1 N-acetylneuraminate synthase family protein [Vibrio vulnificus]MCU8247084.1 N-acetylneuraminate synthase family protein [Vibrio vulnificus]